MKLWTFQEKFWWDSLQKNGFIESKREDVISGFGKSYHFSVAEFYERPYDWMSAQMRERLPDYTKENNIQLWPIWAWYQWDSLEKKKPDLRSYRSFVGYLFIEFEIDESLVLLSDFETWHFVLNDWYLQNETKYSEFCNCEYKAREKTWTNIFNLDYFGPRDTRPIQATLWQINLSQVTKVKVIGERG